MISNKTFQEELTESLFDKTSFHPLALDEVMKSTKKKKGKIGDYLN